MGAVITEVYFKVRSGTLTNIDSPGLDSITRVSTGVYEVVADQDNTEQDEIRCRFHPQKQAGASGAVWVDVPEIFFSGDKPAYRIKAFSDASMTTPVDVDGEVYILKR